jgi:hypothetical protein
MLIHFSQFVSFFRALCSQVIFLRSKSKAPIGFLKWTFINVQNQKPKVEFTFSLLLKKIHENKMNKM